MQNFFLRQLKSASYRICASFGPSLLQSLLFLSPTPYGPLSLLFVHIFDHLRLPRPSHPRRWRSLLARRKSTNIRSSLRLTTEPPLSFCDSRNPLILHLNESADRSCATRLLARRLLVGGQVETDEEEEITAEDTDTSESSKLFTSAAADVGQ